MIDKFLKRTWIYNERMMDAVVRLGLVTIDVESVSSAEELVNKCLAAIQRSHNAISLWFPV
jgi:hypothetical protein